MKVLALAVAGLLAMTAQAAPPRPAPRPAVTDWSQIVSRTPAGDFVQGNPAAKVLLVEYLSFTCPHCANIEGQMIGPLTADFIRTGKVRFEVRHAIRDPFDMAATVLARCGGPKFYFDVAPAIYATQQEWFGRAEQWAQANPLPDTIDPGAALARIAGGTGLEPMLRQRGLTAQREAACLADKAEQQRLATASEAIWKSPGFSGTPTFEINGVRLPSITSWPQLAARIAGTLN